MLGAGPVLITSGLYLAFLFVLAYLSDRRAANQQGGLINTPLVYTLSLTVYCTSWTFYGAVGLAARSGLEFITIYLGPTLVFLGWWFLLRKLVRISKTHRITSIADFISSRYGKSTRLSVLVTIMAVVGTTPYIALQLKAIATSFNVVSGAAVDDADILASSGAFYSDTGFLVAASMAAFIILFGTRNIGADQHHHGVVAAIAFESLVKLIALIAVGLLVVYNFGQREGFDIYSAVSSDPKMAKVFTSSDNFGPRWFTMLILSAAAIICLPRQFQVTVVEISDERNLRTASWFFPLYLFLISLFVIPIALAGLTILPEGSNPDLYVLTVPIAAGVDSLALLAFIGGFSSATSMMIVASIALSIMISNHIVMPILFRLRGPELDKRGDLTGLLLGIRRTSIIIILLLGYIYYRVSAQSTALASIGLTSFAAVAQFLPPIIGGIYWRNGTERGAIAGLIAGFAVWGYTLLGPTFERAGYYSGFIENGPWGITMARPEALFGVQGWDPLAHSLFWSYTANIAAYILFSLLFAARPLDRLQSALFVRAFAPGRGNETRVLRRSAAVEDLLSLTQRFIGPDSANRSFRQFARSQGHKEGLPDASAEFITFVERQLAGSIGAASARVMVSRISVGEMIGLDEVIEILDETQQAIEYSQQLEQKSEELEHTAAQLRSANEKLKQIDRMKDDFLSRVSHELRTPMTSIHSFSEILLENEGLGSAETARFLGIIVSESKRLTRLLDDILDISLIEQGYRPGREEVLDPSEALREAMDALKGLAQKNGIDLIDRTKPARGKITGDRDRVKQVFINLLSNAIKFNDHKHPFVQVETRESETDFTAIFSDNGRGIAVGDQEMIFTKFERLWDSTEGTGLGLAISKQIVDHLGGSIAVQSKKGHGATFIVTLPISSAQRVSDEPLPSMQ